MDILFIVLQVAILVGFSGLYSGLNISLMSLSRGDLRRKAKLGDRDAIRVLPFRVNSHLTLGSILLANVAVVSASALVLEHYTSGIVAGIVSTILIVVFGEVLPQTYFVKRALKFCANLAPFLRLTVIVTYPLSKPLQLLLDKIVGEEGHRSYTRGELGLIIGEQRMSGFGILDEDEIEIIQHALQLSEKSVKEIMQPVERVFWLSIDSTLDGKTVDEIKAHGYSRVPVFAPDMSFCHGVLLMKDMVDINFVASPIPVRNFRLHETKVVGSRTALDTMFRKFSRIATHLVPVEQAGKIVGILTVEDLVEEILGHEIADETDHAMSRA